jgi:TetR/AcrR family transcriptional regulator, transcriptional repressor for nem operon
LENIPTGVYLCAVKNADTRERILHRMFMDIHKNGFQGLRADKVVSEMDITKGALYHYFPSKQAIGIAVVDEIIRPNYLAFYRELDQSTDDPIALLKSHIEMLSQKCDQESIALGCPLNNLVQEMSPLDEDFRLRLKSVVDIMQHSTAAALRRGQAQGSIREDIDVEAAAHFYLSSLEGAYGIAKVQRSLKVFRGSMQMLSYFFDSLRK